VLTIPIFLLAGHAAIPYYYQKYGSDELGKMRRFQILETNKTKQNF